MDATNNNTDRIPHGSGHLERLVFAVRDSLGAEVSPCATINEDQYSDDTLSDRTGIFSRNKTFVFINVQFQTGFLRMVNRQHLMNSSNYSLSSLFSLGSVSGSVASLQGSTRSSTSAQGSTRVAKRALSWKGPTCLHSLYTLLIQPFEEYFINTKNSTTKITNRRELILVLEGDLYLVPFPVLRSSNENSEYLCERFSLLAIPNIYALKSVRVRKQDTDQNIRSLIVGNPKLSTTVSEHWGWKDIPQAEQEANMVAELLQTQAIVGSQATKEHVLTQMQEAECIHFSTHVSWKMPSLILGPSEVLEQSQSKRIYMTENAEEEDSNDVSTTAELPALSEFLLTSSEIISLKLSARLVVVNSSHTKDQQGWATSEGLVTLIKALLMAGAQAVLISLWPVPDTATKILLRAFYSSLLQGTRASR